jgi:hypothetical protein
MLGTMVAMALPTYYDAQSGMSCLHRGGNVDAMPFPIVPREESPPIHDQGQCPQLAHGFHKTYEESSECQIGRFSFSYN